MSKKRFERWNDCSCKVKDNQEGILLRWEDVVDKLNEQQAIIEELEMDKAILKERLRECSMRVDKLLGNCR